ncbi:MAG: N-6 DNA methylase, partial [Candidatus Pacebacteria bacterium]|nr:N-6 DNA methylase [Candidatus Paceibacterota bacterium]
AWHKLFDSKLSNQEKADLYIEGIHKLSKAKHLPELFRDIFKDAFLPFRAPDTIAMFLGEINKFDYKHSENLGNAFEYLLSFLSVQGDLGSFRTPRNIIEFIVDAVDPQKEDTILDPACGTAGFLIEAYKHITQDNKLSPNEIQSLAKNIHGIEIDPGMAKIARVNLYLHGFKTPHITEDDTLSNENLWGKKYDVILANPPFMSPKGGIVPHDKFGVNSKRAEVLFSDYIAEHLKLGGRAGVVVPEGVIFQSGTAYKQLRKMLVEDNYLWAVVSLPAGVFNPYSGVKTSILLFDRARAEKNTEVLFFQVDNDGYGLGAQRKEISGSELPEALEVVKKWKEGSKVKCAKALYIDKKTIAKSGEYKLSIDNYREAVDYSNVKWPMVELGSIAKILNGYSFKSEKYTEQGIRIIRITNVQKGKIIDSNPKFYPEELELQIKDCLLKEKDLLVSLTGNVGRVGLIKKELLPAGLNQRVGCIRLLNKNEVLLDYLFHVLNADLFESECIRSASGIAQKNLSTEWLKKFKIPLPPLDTQKKIVEEIDRYQSIVDGAEQIINNWKPSFDVDPEWKLTELKDVCHKITDGTHHTPKYTETGVPFLRVTDITESNDSKKFISSKEHMELIKRCRPEKGDVLYSKNGTIGIAKLIDWDWEFSIFVSLCLLKPNKEIVLPKFLELFLNSSSAYSQAVGKKKSGTITNLHLIDIKTIKIPVVSIEKQKQIVDEIEEEKRLIDSAQKLIEVNKAKIKNVIDKIWG